MRGPFDVLGGCKPMGVGQTLSRKFELTTQVTSGQTMPALGKCTSTSLPHLVPRTVPTAPCFTFGLNMPLLISTIAFTLSPRLRDVMILLARNGSNPWNDGVHHAADWPTPLRAQISLSHITQNKKYMPITQPFTGAMSLCIVYYFITDKST